MCRQRNPRKMTKLCCQAPRERLRLKHEESEDPTLICKPHDDANERLKAKVLQNISRNFDVSSLHMFGANQALWRIFMNACMWATVHLSKDPDDTRIIQKVEVQKIQTVLETVQVQISNLKLHDEEINGLPKQVDWTDGHWRKYSLLGRRIADQFKSKKYVFRDSVVCLGGKCPDRLEAPRTFEKYRITCVVESPECRRYITTSQEHPWNLYDSLTWRKRQSTFSNAFTR